MVWIAIYGASMETVDVNGVTHVLFVFESLQLQIRVSRRLLTHKACCSRTVEYRPSVAFLRNSLCSTASQYSPVWLIRSMGKRDSIKLYGRLSQGLEIPNLRVYLAKIDIDHGLDFPILTNIYPLLSP